MDKDIAQRLWLICSKEQMKYNQQKLDNLYSNEGKAEHARQQCVKWALAARELYEQFIQERVNNGKIHVSRETTVTDGPDEAAMAIRRQLREVETLGPERTDG